MDMTAPRILVVAAAPALQFTLEELLRAYGYEVATAPSSAAAARLIAREQFAAVLLDPTLLAMPTLDQPAAFQRELYKEAQR